MQLTNMQLAERINDQLPVNDAPYFNQEIHDYLLSKGAKFKQLKDYILSYEFEVSGEAMRLVFYTDLDQGNVKVQYWFEYEDEELMPTASWITHALFSIPVGYNAFGKFKQVLYAYIESL